jgi:hypothetical protein
MIRQRVKSLRQDFIILLAQSLSGSRQHKCGLKAGDKWGFLEWGASPHSKNPLKKAALAA